MTTPKQPTCPIQHHPPHPPPPPYHYPPMRESAKKGHWWQDGIGIDETKFSVLVVLLVIAFLTGMWFVIANEQMGTIDPAMVSLINTLIYAIAGINIANGAAKILDNRRRVEDYERYNPYQPGPYNPYNPNPYNPNPYNPSPFPVGDEESNTKEDLPI